MKKEKIINTSTCAVDIETTGLNPQDAEIIQLAVMPLTDTFKPDKNIPPFCEQIRARYPQKAAEEALILNGLNPLDGIEKNHAIVSLIHWMCIYGIDIIAPLGHNYKFDFIFLQKFLTHELYEHVFHYHNRDTMVLAMSIKDKMTILHNEVQPKFNSCSLKGLSEALGVDYSGAHNALRDCEITAEVYRKLIELEN